MTLDSLRPHTARFFHPLVKIFTKLGLTPNACTVLSLVAAGVAGVAFYYSDIGIGILMVLLNAVFDALDGAIAREMGVASTRGDFLDHVVDRYADIFIITGIFAGPLVPWPIGVFALTGVLMSSYLGTQAQAVGVGRYYGGILGRADRLVLILIAGALDIIIPAGVFGMHYLCWLMPLFGIFGHFTAVQRFAYVWRRID